ncbi:MFS transporter [Amycolatopsis sp. H20-H5]|uniref:MFS transporter n=1 Tax=Amycolatopsis sp. H20-H5 TaxID=3046309 RepID=UPI002DBCE82D|nr:MFS transporter [Amycolatopsis sp. H20-H5]MEC3978103.1 MFS transporter [Amycolatopsis sp. H20-H5]
MSNEATFISGPLVVTAVLSVTAPIVLIAAGALATVAGVLGLATAPVLREAVQAHPCPAEKPTWLGPLKRRRVLTLLLIAAAGTFGVAAMQVGAASMATSWNNTPAAGLVVSALSVGAVVSGLVYGARTWRGDRRCHLTVLYALSGVLLLATMAAPTMLTLGVAFAAVGLVAGARDAIEQLVLGAASPDHQRTETFAWLTTFMWGGFAVGSATAGRLATSWGTASPFLAAAVLWLIAAAFSAMLRRKALQRSPQTGDFAGLPQETGTGAVGR